MKWIRTEGNKGPVIRENSRGEMSYLTFPALEECNLVEHLFTTRLGGVSEGIYASMNLSFSRGDKEEHVLENYRRVAKVLGCGVEDMVATRQTHTTNIRLVTSKDKGKGVISPTDYEDIDGFITNEPGIVLAAFYADCVPLYFVDVENKAIGLAHSGWRGTIGGMGACMVEAMKEHFNSKPENILTAIGPSICKDCYEVDLPVAQQFVSQLGEQAGVLTAGREEGKYQLDLWRANEIILQRAHIPAENISVTDICTCHNPQYLFSHRASKGKRGNLGAFLMLKKN